jgi:hypothetical protein
MTSILEDRLKKLLGLSEQDLQDLRDQFRSIPLPKLQYGYQRTPLTWEQLQDIILVENNLAKLSRSSSQQREYEIFRFCLIHIYASALDYILISKFQFDKKRGEDGRWQAVPSLQESTETRQVLVLNDFPYFTEDGIVHHILWKLKGSILPVEIEEAKKNIQSQMNAVDSLHWINPPHLQSLPDIEHVHILSRLQTDNLSPQS